ncbi:hypothetical protein PIB30_084950 [Stylosanthes scabra]|uniref:Protein argonaute N-terminal domain-containing protein n=1 Tax=Stylosanthes scabra TaxID=79078 RepID=A0ABU6YRP8_9FABA|nr:hypothetical protein [Stylosanthes scabra]
MPLFAGSTAAPRRAVATPFVSSSLLLSSVSLLLCSCSCAFVSVSLLVLPAPPRRAAVSVGAPFLCSCSRTFVSVSLLVLPAPPRRAAVSVGAPFLCSCFAVQSLLPTSPFSIVPSLLCLIFPDLCLSKSPFLTSLRELTTLGIKNAENLAIPSVKNNAAFLFTVVGTTGFLGLLAGQLPGVALSYKDGRPVEGKGAGRKVIDKVKETYDSELNGKDLAYDGEKILFTVGSLTQNKLEFTASSGQNDKH